MNTHGQNVKEDFAFGLSIFNLDLWLLDQCSDLGFVLYLHTIDIRCAKYEHQLSKGERGLRIRFKYIWPWPLDLSSYPYSEIVVVI